jgi:hypothetical protein
MQPLLNQVRVIYDMQTELVGTLEAEKVYTFSTQPVHGLSYRIVNPKHVKFKTILGQCWKYIESSVERNNTDLIKTVDVVQRVADKVSDFWVTVDSEKGEIVGCFVIGAAAYPQSTGIMAEAIGGEFNFPDVVPVVEKYYKNLGYSFFEMTGRKGWEKVMNPLGFELTSITVYKRL